ncbi:MAG: hypothetical protein NVS2B12_00670 [Ktedonobacteraceae bacterium]
MLKNEIWRKRLAQFYNRGGLYPAPEPMPRTRTFWLATSVVTLAMLGFAAYFITFLFARQDAFQTNAEDFGIMDQAIWNTVHGHPLHQTICNIVFDTNCASPGGIMRFAIHFEPILFPISLCYLIWSNPKVLFIIQTIVVASGAYAAFWLARLRLHSSWAGVAVACLYLLYPVLHQATVSDFHAVTLTAALLLFALYFLYTRRTAWFFVFAILAMACKEEVPLIVLMIGLWSMFFQRRWISGGGIALLACGWFLLGYYVIMPHFSPTGHPLLLSRYNDIGASPLGLVKNMVFHPRVFLNTYLWEKDHFAYIHVLLGPAGYIPGRNGDPIFYLPLLAPWVMILALPVLLLNLVSSNPQMYSGLFHYSAEIVPIIIFAVIEALVLLVWIVRFCAVVLARLGERSIQSAQSSGKLALRSRTWGRAIAVALLLLLSLGMVASSLRSDYYFHGQLPFSQGFSWPQSSAHIALAQHFIDQVPENASVSAQSKIVPHMSHRDFIYMFPYQDTKAEYVLLDVTSDIYPYGNSSEYASEVKRLLLSGNDGIVASQDGYLLLKRGVRAPGISASSPVRPDAEGDPTLAAFNVPESFCSNLYVSPREVVHPLDVAFTGSGGDSGKMHLVGYDYSGSGQLSKVNGYVHVTTYWRVESPITTPLQLILVIQGVDGKDYIVSNDVPELLWCQSNIWKPGSIVRVTSRDFNLQASDIPRGLAHLSIALLPLVQSSSTIMDIQARLPLRILNAPGTVKERRGMDALQLMPLTIVA